jgi:hypothetical protein
MRVIEYIVVALGSSLVVSIAAASIYGFIDGWINIDKRYTKVGKNNPNGCGRGSS